MSGFRIPGPVCQAVSLLDINDGTLCCWKTPYAPPAGTCVGSPDAYMSLFRGQNDFFWGVDSFSSPTDKIGKLTRYEQVAKSAGQAPRFWGRYISGAGFTLKEAEYLWKNSCSILTIFNEPKNVAGSLKGKFKDGEKEANRAIKIAANLGVTPGVCIYADIETEYQPTQEWIEGWAETMYDSHYSGGFYCNPQSSNFSDPFCKAYNNNDKVASSYIYSSEPEKNAWKGPASQAPTTFAPSTMPCNPQTVVWQYAEAWNYVSTTKDPWGVDEDLATADAYFVMW